MMINQKMLPKFKPVPEAWLQDWLSSPSSLTEKLCKLTGDAKVKVLCMDWGKTNSWEKELLSISDSKLLRREVLITSHQKPCWYARTFIPESCYQLDPEFFQRLNHLPLSELIYSQEKVQRDALFYYPIPEGAEELSWLPDSLVEKNDGRLWARLASFRFNGVSSFFLCEILFERQLDGVNASYGQLYN